MIKLDQANYIIVTFQSLDLKNQAIFFLLMLYLLLRGSDVDKRVKECSGTGSIELAGYVKTTDQVDREGRLGKDQQNCWLWLGWPLHMLEVSQSELSHHNLLIN